MKKLLLAAATLAGYALTVSPAAAQATWTALANLMPAGTYADTMILLTDGTVMVLNDNDLIHWIRLTPDAKGSYINGTWTSDIAPMSSSRLYFASNVLPNGKVWVMGGEYAGADAAVDDDSATGEIFDPVANTWSPVSPFPNQSCGADSTFPGTLTLGSPVITQINATASWQAGWMVSGSGIPSSAVIASVDSASQIHISQSATQSGPVVMSLSTQSTGGTTMGSKIITGIASTAGYLTGWGVGGTGIPSTATISSIDSATQIHISQSATATGTAVALNFAISTAPPSCVGDDPSILLPGELVLAGDLFNSGTHVYNIANNTWASAANKVYSDTSEEEGWAMLSDGSVINYDISKSIAAKSGYAELYNPASNSWSGISPADGTAQGVLPLLSSPASGYELGPILRLYDDRMFAIGSTGHTALYTPATNAWAAGPDVGGNLGGAPFLFSADDAPAAILPNGHVILAADAGLLAITSSGSTTLGSRVITGITSVTGLQTGVTVSGNGIPDYAYIQTVDSSSQITISSRATATAAGVVLDFGGNYSGPAQLFDFDPVANAIGPVSPSPTDPNLPFSPAFALRMLMLPNGQLLLADGSSRLWVYAPVGSASPALQPAITSVSSNGHGLFTLSGTQLSGQSAGAMYGDDVQMNENYPIVSFTSATGAVYYARTTNWSYVGVGGGALPQTVNFTLNSAMPAGSYSIIVSAAGIASNSVAATVSSDLNTVSVLPAITNVEDAESGRTTVVPGEWAAIYGTGLSGTTRPWGAADFTAGNTLPTTLSGVSVKFNGIPAAVYYVSPGQLDVQVPFGLGGAVSVIVTINGATTLAFTTTAVANAPSVYYYPAGNAVYAAATHANGSLIGDPSVEAGSTKAAAGETIAIYVNGLAASPSGSILGAIPYTATPVTVSFGGASVTAGYSGVSFAGGFQVNVQIPPKLAAGNYALTISTAGQMSQSGIILPVGP